ncbi:hypothetical protein MTR67_027213 [Solanum verrucosum]|uniref:Uncharacterized protein n=1 Tax=Solanum verrucosum TaxID=315347 RepID=A0AAF0R4B3_SOLVR|nr:hypothetical protein MTR67_027213 [Solanum verrucosum]
MGATLLVSLPVLNILSVLNSVSCFMLNEYLNLMKGVGPNLAISFSIYDTVRSYCSLIVLKFVPFVLTSRYNYINTLLDIRPDDSTVLVSIACGSLSGVASSTGK